MILRSCLALSHGVDTFRQGCDVIPDSIIFNCSTGCVVVLSLS